MSTCTVTVTVSGEEASPPVSVTVRLKVRVVSTATVGATNVGVAEPASNATAGEPPVWDQAYVRAWFWGSRLALPSSVTRAPVITVRSAPASAVGAVLFAAAVTVTVTVSVLVRPPGSVAVSRKVRVASSARSFGAVKVGRTAVALESATVAPAVWVQA